ncbi:GtrA family protein [Nocardioides cavernae]|uniref:GtrA family protein n=1 Tax=Nocardioides cavernae TaxID=1921566 RepID=A0ABR8NFI5_9ACTN|nr:GtrA family protein [Nocardioides cavernae]MBD3926016.1 GtrA family protein [Nocardioides cavernae]MBM7513604.1 putative flippase GtrA [Nocardioides cavernae]
MRAIDPSAAAVTRKSMPSARDTGPAANILGTRSQRMLAELGRFLTVGGVATIVAFILFNVLVHGFSTGNHALLRDRPILAYVLANSVGMVISYRGARSWAFRDRPPRQADGGRSAYVLINLATMSLPIACLIISRDVLGFDDPLSDNISANLIGLVLGLAARFYLFRRFVFRRPVTPRSHFAQRSELVDAVDPRDLRISA